MGFEHPFQHLANLKTLLRVWPSPRKSDSLIQGNIIRTHTTTLSSGTYGSHCQSIVTLFELEPSLPGIRSLFNRELYENLPIVRSCHLKFIHSFIHVTNIIELLLYAKQCNRHQDTMLGKIRKYSCSSEFKVQWES